MVSLTFLGSSSAIPSQERENTHFLLQAEQRKVLIDCAGNPFTRLSQAGSSALQLTDVILTHFHPDHVSGMPSLLMGMWLLGYQRALHVYGLAHTLDRLEMVMDAYGWDSWPRFFPVSFHRLPEQEYTLVLEDGELRILASPVHHVIPTIGLRIELRQARKVIAYSADTEPCGELIRLANGADILIHEASGEGIGHSSALQAAEIARQAEVGALYLIHYPDLNPSASSEWLSRLQDVFPGPIFFAQDLMRLEFREV
jgi:ribonuclease Z